MEIFNRGSFSATGSMLLARRSAAAVTLKDGRVLVAGGSTSSGPTSETELYNPVTRSWTIGDSMLASRSGHTATLLADGRVLIAGGEGSGAPGATLEIFNPDTGSFSAAGTLTTPRKNHAAVLLSGGRVMIVGGFDGSHILNSTEIFDPATAKVSSGPSLSIARMGHSATTLLNGDLLVAGGSDGSQDLASAELYSASGTSASASSGRTDGFTSAANMLSARSSHSAFLLPHNAAVLMAGGSSASAELYQAWNSAFIPTGSPANSRSGAAGTPLAADGLLLLAGGTTSTAELYGFPTIKTDKDDYSPGVRAIITGGRWAAGEAVTLVFVEVPKRHPDQFLQLTADASGDLYYDQWAPERHDVGVRFYVTAAGSRSGSQAQMTFTDGDKTWNGNVSTVWTNTSNWTGGVVPGASDKAIIPAGRPFYPVISGAKQSVGSIQIDSGASLTVSSDLVLSKSTSTADSVVISGTLDWTSGAITFASTSVSLTVNSGGVFKLRNTTLGMPAFPAISLNANSTVEYGGANQTIKVDSVLTTYGHLKTSGTGVKTWSTGTAAIINGNLDVGAASTLTLGGHITVNGNLSIGSGTTLGVGSNRNITLMGNWTNNGTFAQGGSGATVTLNSSTAQQTIGGTTATTFINLTISNASGYGIRLSQNATVNAGLGLSTGIIDAATDNTTLKVAWSGSCCTNTSSSYVIGKFARDYSGAGSKKFPVGKGGNYRPATIYFTTLTGVSTTAPATITVEQFESNIPGGTAPNTSLLGSRYWHVTQVGGSSGFVYNITLDGTGTSPTRPVKTLRASGGTPVAFPVTGTAPNYLTSGLTASGGDFALAQDANPTSLAVTSATGTYGATINLSATLTSNGSPVSGKTISFTLNGNIVGTATTTSGVATVNSVSLAATNAGTYSTGVGASFAGDATYEATSALNFLTVNKAAATIGLGDLSQTYDGTPKPPTATTSPAGLGEINFTYNSSSTTPTNAGSYSFVASLNNVNYTASNVSGTLVIGKAAATIALGALAQTYDGSPKSATATPSPAGLSGVSVTYEGSPDAPINASSYAVEASLSNDNYQASNVGGTLVIGKASATIALSNLSQAYNGSPKQATAATNPSGLPGVTITYDGSETALSSVGTYAVVASLINTNYAASDATGNLVIAKGTATITLGGLTHTYDGLAKSATASSPDGDVIITYDESPTPPTNAGSYAVLASVNNGNYLASVSGTLVISKAAATITLGGLTHTYDGSAKSATVTTSPEGLSGVTIKYDGSTTAPTQAGSYSVVATLDNTNYDGSTTGTLMISKAATSITMSNLAQTYDGSAKSATATTNPELSGVTITYNGLTTAINAGSYAVVASLTNPNYEAPNATATMVIAKATTTITLSNLAQTYNGSPKTATATTNPAGLSGVSITYNGSAAAPSDAASYAVVASLNNANYEPASASDTLVIGKATATIILSNLSQTYDGASKHATAPTTPAGLSGVSITYDGLATEPINAGSYHVVASLNNENYNPVSASGTLVIGKATATMTLNGLAPTYDGSPKPVTATTSPADLTVISITYDGSTAAPTGAGSYVVVASLSNDNYLGSVSGSLIIGKATATITLSDLAHTYDDLPKSATATTSPADLTVVTITYNGSPTVPVNAGSYAVAASLSNDNYQGSASGTLVISKAAAIITLDGLAHIYDGSTKPATATTSPADLTVVTITYNGSATTPTNAGSYAVVASLANSNYEASNAIGTLVIDKASASITLGNSNLTFTYDGSAKSATAATVPGGLSFSITYNGSTTAPIGAGNYTVVASVTNPNYAASDAAGTLDISKALAVITLGNLTQTYDGPAKPASATTSPSGLNGVSITYDGLASAPADAGSYAVVASLTNANYTASDATGTLTINKATATTTDRPSPPRPPRRRRV
ncbi:MAG: hypothetical protein DMG13_25810 [Acidobacteria bacterium]|nr:MAG: hypothetical protein DMG13_25810 [Acidobacteriota bacterium]